MRTVKLSWKSAQWLLHLVEKLEGNEASRVALHLRMAMKLRPALKVARLEKKAKAMTKRDRTAAIRRVVWLRAGERCEWCTTSGSAFNPLDVDHFWGKARAESLESCWLLCRNCHKRKHAGAPSRRWWIGSFAMHCSRHGYAKEVRRAREKFEALKLAEASAAAGKAAREAQQ